MKRYILIEIDTEHSTISPEHSDHVCIAELTEYVAEELNSMGVYDTQGVVNLEVYTLEELHHHSCLLMDGVA